MGTFRWLLTAVLLAGTCTARAAPRDMKPLDMKPLLDTLLAVGPKGEGNPEAAQAWAKLVEADAAQLPAILTALNDARPLAANWIRCAVDAVAERQLRRGGKLPAAGLEKLVLDPKHAPRARRLAYEWLLRVDPTASDRLIPGMLNDPSVEMRRDAVARLIDEAGQVAQRSEPAKAVPLYRRALSAARDLDQIRLLAARLEKLGQEVDLPRHFGFILRWKLIGPFDNTDEKGFAVAYPPEREVNLDASYPGKHGDVKWVDYESKHEYGRVDFNKPLGEEKGVAGYATAEFISDRRQQVELRLGSDNAVKLWLNGALLDGHDVYHAGFHMDQYVSRAVLRPGRNVILVKVCQNEQTQSWAREWGFQLRVCDATGGAVLSSGRQSIKSK